MNTTQKFMFDLCIGTIKAIAHTGEFTFAEFMKMFDTDDDYNTFVSGVNVVTEMKNGILYVTDFEVK